jgi:hypothetical protein
LKNFEKEVMDPVDQLVSNMRTAEDMIDLDGVDSGRSFNFKSTVNRLKLDQKVMKLDLESINKSLEAVKQRRP